jgi:hypothetical protein
MGGGSIEGYYVDDCQSILEKFEGLLSSNRLIEKYGREDKFLFAVGDGNHSLATAKACYNPQNPLSAYALVEIVNIYDEGLKFEPIHRVVYNVDNEAFINGLKNAVKGDNETSIINNGKIEKIAFAVDPIEGVALTQNYIDEYIKTNGGTVDYIHGYDSLIEVTNKTNGVGIELKPIDKDTFFTYIAKNGPLPRKTFSMGEANEKRYYMEARKIK